jgi:hypothetical protein
MIILGVILLILGLVFNISILTTIGIILLVVGAVLFLLGSFGRPVAGRRHYWERLPVMPRRSGPTRTRPAHLSRTDDWVRSGMGMHDP